MDGKMIFFFISYNSCKSILFYFLNAKSVYIYSIKIKWCTDQWETSSIFVSYFLFPFTEDRQASMALFFQSVFPSKPKEIKIEKNEIDNHCESGTKRLKPKVLFIINQWPIYVESCFAWWRRRIINPIFKVWKSI